MVAEPVFLPREQWIAQPLDWKPNIQSGAGIDLASGEGLRIWEACLALAGRDRRAPVATEAGDELGAAAGGPCFGASQLVRPRLGQGTFRVAVTAAYGGACAVSGEHSLPALEAAHIRPYTSDGTHDVPNGLLLRADIHRLFDKGYVTVTPDHRFVVSERLAKEWENGKIYYERSGTPIALPRKKSDRPDSELLRWHNDNVFEKGIAA
jgi:putative restriction endonuclease